MRIYSIIAATLVATSSLAGIAQAETIRVAIGTQDATINTATGGLIVREEKLLEKYHWPGNVRELENAIRRAHVLAKSDAILPGDLPPEISGGATGVAAPPTTTAMNEGTSHDAATLARQLFQIAKKDPKLKVIPAVERELVIQALKETSDNQVHAAKLLGITRATLRKRIEKFGIQRELNVK